MAIPIKRKAQASRSACAFVLSCSLVAQGAIVSPVRAQNGAAAADAPANPVRVPSTATAPEATVSQAPALTGRLDSITISGNSKISTAAIQAVLSQKTGEQYVPDTAEKDREAIKAMGYFNGEVGLAGTKNASGGVDLTYTVAENPTVKQILFTANTKDGKPTISADKLKSLMDTKEDQVLNTNVLVRDLDKLFNRQTGYVRSQGYIFDVSSDINIDPTSGTLTIPLIETHIDSIRVTGNKKTKPVVITRELREKSGDVFDGNRLQKELTKIYNLGLFDEVGPYDLIPTDVGRVIISIPVTEKRSGQVSVGVGYSSRSKLVGRAELAENNFRGLGERVSVMWEVGGVSSQSSLDLGFYEPYLDKHHTSLDVDLFDRAVYRFSSDTFGGSSGNDNTYIERHRGAVLGLHRPLTDTTTVGVSGRIENVRANDVEVPPQDVFIRQVGTVSAFGVNGVQNTRDNDFSPAGGAYRSVSLEAGVADTSTVNNAPGPLQPGRHSFTKLGVDMRQYFSLQGPRTPGKFNEPKKVLAMRMLLGFTNSQVPFFEQYFVGGSESLRGYQTDRYWGNNLALFQGELRIPVGKDNNVQGVLFADAGDAWGSIYHDPQLEQHQKFSVTTDFGLGLRLVTPVGPIRLDYAIGKDGGKTQFSIGQSF